MIFFPAALKQNTNQYNMKPKSEATYLDAFGEALVFLLGVGTVDTAN